MDLAGQDMFRRRAERACQARGYAMAALLVGLAIMSVMLAVAMPVWKTASQREKEAELVFRGQQYARAIGLFQRRAGPGALPPNLDVLVQQRFLRKKYKDPITNDDFQLLLGGQAAPGSTPAPDQGRGGGGGNSTTPGGGRGGFQIGGQTPGAGGTTAVGGIQGVVSKSKAKSLRLFNGRAAYDQWSFVFVPQQQSAGGPGGAGGITGPGGAAGGRGGPGFPGGTGGTFGPGGAGGPGGRGAGPGGFGGPGGRGAGPGGFGAPQFPGGPGGQGGQGGQGGPPGGAGRGFGPPPGR